MKKLKFLLCSILIISLLAFNATGTNVRAEDAGGVIEMEAKAAALVDMDTGALIFSQNASERLYPASLTKIMTAMLTIKHGRLTDKVTASENAVTEGMSIYGSSQDIQAGETMTVENLLYATLVSSANEACNILAEYVAGSIDKFVELMNREAKSLGCENTHFANPHGLHDENHYTCAEDLAKITYAAMQYSDFAKICNTKSILLPATNMSEARQLYTTNYLISNETVGGYYYPNACGVKTGFTTPAGYCLVSTADNGKMHVLGVILGAEKTITEYGVEKVNSFLQMEKLFDWAFGYYTLQQVVFPTLPVAQVNVKYGSDTNFVLVYPAEERSYLLPKDFDVEQIEKTITIYNEDSVEAPVNRGDVMGKMELTYRGASYGTVDLLALTNVERSGFEATAAGVKHVLSNRFTKMVLLAIPILIVAYVIYMILYNKARRKALEKGKYRGDAVARMRHDRKNR